MTRPKPSGARIYYPICGDWTCDDYDYDWEDIDSGDDPERYRAVKREHQIVTYHQPQAMWRSRLQDERDKRNHGDPLWMDL